jgi:SWIM/SEC-C metal-binding protein
VKELESVFEENGWKYTIELEPDKPENITDLEILLNPLKRRIAEKKVGRNEPCPCGSGKKYKKCCGK